MPDGIRRAGAYMVRGYAAHTPRERRSTERLYLGLAYAAHTARVGYVGISLASHSV